MFDVLCFVLSAALIILSGWGVVISNEIIEERKQHRREGTHDYYGNKIEEDDDK
jgi:hypothetical protein